MLREFLDFPLLRLDPHFSQKLRRYRSEHWPGLSDGELLRHPLFHRFLLRWAWCVRLSWAQVEFVHGRNRRRCTKDTSFATFLTDYMLDETKLRMPVQGIPATSAILQRDEKPHAKRVRKQSAIDVFSKDYHASQRAQKRRFNAIRHQSHADELHAAFAALPLERQRDYESLAALTPSAADARASAVAQAAALADAGADPPIADHQPSGGAADGTLAVAIRDPLNVRQLNALPLAEAEAAPKCDDHPLPSAVAQRLWADGGGSIQKMADAFAKSNIIVAMQSGPDLPAVARHPRAATQLELDFGSLYHQHIEKAIMQFAEHYSPGRRRKVSALHTCNLAAAFEFGVGDEREAGDGFVQFVHVAAGLCAAGGKEGRLNLIRLEPIGRWGSYADLVLRYSRSAHIRVAAMPHFVRRKYIYI